MSMKRLAIMAAMSHFNGYAKHNLTTTTSMVTTTTQGMTTLPSSATVLATDTVGATATVTATTMSFAGNAAYHRQNYNYDNHNSSSPQIGGLGLFHQQYLRSGSSASIGGFTVGGGAVAPGMGISNGASGGSSSNSINGNVNVLLGGAMLSVVTTVLCVVCYCCHRSIKKRTEAAYRQRWMDNDANMEIYSVEQCYETSGLFMESSEGLAVPALSHQPPPSYDAVVAMQEENHTARISPPPDYQSMNDVSGSPNANEMPKFIRGSNLLGMKKVLSAQSCCSLQRAEVENLFQLGVVAAAAATSGRFGASALGRKSLPYTTSRDTANTVAGEARFSNQPYYRGCPLCGKFRYDDSMSLSSDSGLDQVVVAVDVSNGNATTVGVNRVTCYCTPLQSPTIDDRNNNNECDQRRLSVPHVADDRRSMSSLSDAIAEGCENAINNNNGEETDAPTCNVVSTRTSPSSSMATTTYSAAGVAATASGGDTGEGTLNLDSINENGIIRLDMSKIIDKTGLPTYEAALKLESSGYV